MVIQPLARRDHRATLTASREGCIKSGVATGWGLFGQPHRGRRRNRLVARQQPLHACCVSCRWDPCGNSHTSTLDRGGDLSDNVRRTHYGGQR